MITSLFSDVVTIKRRVNTGRDALNNPNYGNPTSGDGWYTVYITMPCRIALTDNSIKWDKVGERVLPFGTMYYSTAYILQPEDRVLTQDAKATANGAEYVVTAVKVAYKTGSAIDHYEVSLELP
jgi:hypothetical protein